MTARILYTRPDGLVSICIPAPGAMRFMTHGGGRWGVASRGWLEAQIEAQAIDGVEERSARRFVMAMHTGGCTDAEALDIIRERCCAHLGTACEVIGRAPSDRWFRDAWRRSHNGGPIGIDMRVARSIQLARIKDIASRKKADIKHDRWKRLIQAADTPEQLRQIWPRGL